MIGSIFDNFTFDVWVLVGFVGQFMFFSRMILQWFYSEKHKKSLIPIEYWYLSIAGGLIVLVYALHRGDPVFFAGQILAIFIYARNLYLMRKNIKKA